MRSIILFVLCAFMLTGGQETTFRIPLAGDIDEVTFDPSRVSTVEVRRWMQLSPNVGPYNGYLVPENIELCDAKDPRYRGCGKEPESVNLHNAQLNLDRIRQRINDLDPDLYPDEDLKEVALYVRRIQSFALWVETQKLTFVKSGNVSVLESTFEADAIDPKQSCTTILNRITSAQTSRRSALPGFPRFSCRWRSGRSKEPVAKQQAVPP